MKDQSGSGSDIHAAAGCRAAGAPVPPGSAGAPRSAVAAVAADTLAAGRPQNCEGGVAVAAWTAGAAVGPAAAGAALAAFPGSTASATGGDTSRHRTLIEVDAPGDERNPTTFARATRPAVTAEPSLATRFSCGAVGTGAAIAAFAIGPRMSDNAVGRPAREPGPAGASGIVFRARSITTSRTANIAVMVVEGRGVRGASDASRCLVSAKIHALRSQRPAGNIKPAACSGPSRPAVSVSTGSACAARDSIRPTRSAGAALGPCSTVAIRLVGQVHTTSAAAGVRGFSAAGAAWSARASRAPRAAFSAGAPSPPSPPTALFVETEVLAIVIVPAAR